MLAQADQDNIVWLIFQQKHVCAPLANIVEVFFWVALS